VEYLQRVVGYAMTGDTREECLFFAYGKGANGKTKFLELLRKLFGDYGQRADFSSFMAKNGDGPRNDLARMRGARLVTASEGDSDKGFDARVIKLLTGGDTVVARKLYEEHFEFQPQHKLVLAANHKPIVKEQSEGFWRRMRLIPFTVTIPKEKRDGELLKKLEQELPGILNWALRGCLQWQRSGLFEPRAVRRATSSYKDENDLLGEFTSLKCVLQPDAWISTPELYKHFTEWWLDTRGPRSQPISLNWFSRLLSEHPALAPAKRNQVRGWKGITVHLEGT
jgi:putative DNA primase/helicase